MSIAGVVMAAGSSRRLGRPKQAITLGGKTLLRRAVDTALAAGLHPVLAVVRDDTWRESLRAAGVVPVLNPQAQEGMASSVRAGIHALGSGRAQGAVVLTCDQPLLQPQHLQQLCAAPDRVTGSLYAGRVGVPAYFPRQVWGALRALTGDAGARALLQSASHVHDESLALDIDTEEDLQRALQVLGEAALGSS